MAFRRLCACVCDAAPRGPSAPLHTRSRTQSQTPDDSSMTDRTRDRGQSGRHTRAARARARGGVADEHAASRKRKTQKKRKHVRYGKPIIDGPEPDTTRRGTGRTVHADTRGDMDVHRAASARPANGGRIRPCVLLWKCTRLRPHADRWSGAAAGPYVRVCVCVGVLCVSVCACGRTVVATDEGVAILGLELPIYVLLRLLHRNVHEAVEARKHACAAVSKLSVCKEEQGTEARHLGSPRQS